METKQAVEQTTVNNNTTTTATSSFGAYFEAQQEPHWKRHYVDYDTLYAKLAALAAVNGGPAYGVAGANECVTSLTMTQPLDAGRAKFAGNDLTAADWLAALDAEYAKVDDFASSCVSDLLQRSYDLEQQAAKAGAGDMRESRRKKSLAAAAMCADEFLKLEKFVNVNYLGFHHLLKLHDKRFPQARYLDFYVKKMHTMGWIKGNHSKIFVNLSRLMSTLRGDIAGDNKKEEASQEFVRKTTKYWIRTEDISAVKYAVLRHLPVFQFDESVLETGDAQLANSVYLDNQMLDLYHGRINKNLGSQAIRLRWYGTGDHPSLVFVERKTHRDSWTGEESVKERFTLKEAQVVPFIHGEYTLDMHVQTMRAKNKSEEEIEAVSRLFSEVYAAIESKQLQPTMRSQYMRVAYQVPFDETVRVSLDTNLAMIVENSEGHPSCRESSRWYRDPTLPTPRTEITRFPHAVLEIKLALRENVDPPAWVQGLIESGMLCEVHKFSKFLHGCAVLMEPQVREVPYWVDDDSIEASLNRSNVHAMEVWPPLRDRDGIQFMGNPGAGSTIRWRASNLGDMEAGITDTTVPLIASSARTVEATTRNLSTGTHAVGCCFGLMKKKNNMKPRKIPMRIEPKTYFANERTFLSWLHMAVTLGSVGGFKFTLDKKRMGCDGEEDQWIPYSGAILVGVAMVFIVYALRLYLWRAGMIRERRNGPFDDRFGPFFLSFVLFVAFTAMVVVEYLSSTCHSAMTNVTTNSMPSF